MGRAALKLWGKQVMNVMCKARGDELAEWLEAPFKEAAARRDVPLTTQTSLLQRPSSKRERKGMGWRALF